MGRRLNTHVHVTDPDGNRQVLGPGEDVPAWAEKAITNEKVWADQPSEEPPQQTRRSSPRSR